MTIDRIKEKYLIQLSDKDQGNFENLKIINNQIKQIENLVNEFSDFARMPKPILKDNNLILILKDNSKLLSEIDKSIKIEFINNSNQILFNCDREQISQVFLI